MIETDGQNHTKLVFLLASLSAQTHCINNSGTWLLRGVTILSSEYAKTHYYLIHKNTQHTNFTKRLFFESYVGTVKSAPVYNWNY